MNYTLFRTTSFKKSFKKLRSADQELVLFLIEQLAAGKSLDKKYRDHFVKGGYEGCRECHVKPDLLLIYRVDDHILELALIETGSHSDLFE